MSDSRAPTPVSAGSGSLLAVAGVCALLFASPAAGQQARAPTPVAPNVALLTDDPCCDLDPRLEFWLGEPAHVAVFQVYPGLGAARIYPHGPETSVRLDRGRHGFRYTGLQAGHARTVFRWHYGHYAPFRSSVQPFEHVVVIASDRPLSAEALASGRAFDYAPGNSEAGEVVTRLVAAITPEGARIALDRGAWLRFAVANPSSGSVAAVASALSPVLRQPIPIPFARAFPPECDPRSDEHCSRDGEIETGAGSTDPGPAVAKETGKERSDDAAAAEARIRALLAEVARADARNGGSRIQLFEDPRSLLERPEVADRLRRSLLSGRGSPASLRSGPPVDRSFDRESLWSDRERLRPDRGRRSFEVDRPRRPRPGPERPSRGDRGSDRGSAGGSQADDGAGS